MSFTAANCLEVELAAAVLHSSSVIASVSEPILHVYGKNKQGKKSLKIVVESSDWYQKFFFFHVESIFDMTLPGPARPT